MQPARPSPIDVAMGQVIRSHRKRCGFSQTGLGKTAGISVQQMQKYEAGTNRISISRLFMLGEALEISPFYLVAEVQKAVQMPGDVPSNDAAVLELLSSPDCQELMKALVSLQAAGLEDAFKTVTATAKQFAELAERPMVPGVQGIVGTGR